MKVFIIIKDGKNGVEISTHVQYTLKEFETDLQTTDAIECGDFLMKAGNSWKAVRQMNPEQAKQYIQAITKVGKPTIN